MKRINTLFDEDGSVDEVLPKDRKKPKAAKPAEDGEYKMVRGARVRVKPKKAN